MPDIKPEHIPGLRLAGEIVGAMLHHAEYDRGGADRADALDDVIVELRRLLELAHAARPPAAKTVRVRVAVGVDSTGFWSALGGSPRKDEALIRDIKDALYPIPESAQAIITFITATLPIPQPVEVEAEVES